MAQEIVKIVNWRDVVVDRIVVEKPVPKNFDATSKGGQKGSYQTAEIMYIYVAPDGRSIKDHLYIEMMEAEVEGFQEPRASGDSQVSSKPGDLQIKAVYGITKPETRDFLAVMDKIYDKICELIFPMRMDLKSQQFGPQTRLALCKPLIYRPSDAITGQIDETKNASQYYKVLGRGRNETKFYNLVGGPDGKGGIMTIPELKDLQYTGIPLVAVNRLYAGGNGKISIQSHLASMVIHKRIIKLGSTNRQAQTVERFRTQNPDLVEQQERDLRALQATMSGLAGLSLNSAVSGQTTAKDRTPLSETPMSLEKGTVSSAPAVPPPVVQQTVASPPQIAPTPATTGTTVTTTTTTQPTISIGGIALPGSSAPQPPAPTSSPVMAAIPGLPPGFQFPAGFSYPTK